MEEVINCTFYCEDTTTNRKKLFEEALSNAKHGKVLYIVSEELTELPDLSQDVTSSVYRHYMKMISFLYVKTLKDLIESVATLPDWQNVPCTILLDSLNEYCNKQQLQNACGVIALLIDTSRSCSLSLKGKSRICVSINKELVGDEYCNTLLELYGLNV